MYYIGKIQRGEREFGRKISRIGIKMREKKRERREDGFTIVYLSLLSSYAAACASLSVSRATPTNQETQFLALTYAQTERSLLGRDRETKCVCDRDEETGEKIA